MTRLGPIKKRYVVAGNAREAKNWAYENGCVDNYVYVNHPERLWNQNIRKEQVHFVGTWLERSDADEIIKECMASVEGFNDAR